MAPPRGKNIQLSDGIKKLTGTFSAPPPLFVGEVYGGSKVTDPRHKNKQFTAGKWASGPLSETFAKGQYLSEKAKFQEQRRYIDIYGPDKKKLGFLSTDFPRRDEYSNTIRTAQMRECLKKEKRQTVREADRNQDHDMASVPYPEIDMNQPRRFLYDIAHPHDELKTCKRCHRDDMRGRCRHVAAEFEQIRGMHHPEPSVAVDWPSNDKQRTQLRRGRPMTAPASRSRSEAIPSALYDKFCEHCLGQGHVLVKVQGRSIISPCADCKSRAMIQQDENYANAQSRAFRPMTAWE